MKRTSINIYCSVLSQIVTILCGLILPRLILTTFGSQANGLISSLTQMLNYISLVEGGLGGVVLAALYSPLATHDNRKLSEILKTANAFFKKLAIIFLIYTLLLSILYPFFVKSTFSNFYIFSLTFILAISLFIQYFFSITYKLLLQADQKIYIVQIVQIIASLSNLIITIIVINVFPNLQVVKLLSSIIYILQPLFYSSYIEKHYKIDKKVKADPKYLPQRWDCFGQNLAFVIHNNTDMVLLSIFGNLELVSVYSIYFLVVNNLKNFFLSFSNSFSPLLGKAIAINDIKKAKEHLLIYEFIVFNAATIIFGCCIYLLPSFVLLYTSGVHDINYNRPLFSVLLILAEFVYCIRDPYISVVYSAGKFKETVKSAYIEATLNILISLILVFKFNLIGIALGTLISMSYRMINQVHYISQHIINRSSRLFYKRLIISVAVMILSVLILSNLQFINLSTLTGWIFGGIISVIVFIIIDIIINLIFDGKTLYNLLVSIKKDKNEVNNEWYKQ